MHYATRSNQVKKIRTPGNRLVFQKVTKRSQGPHTPWVLGHKRLSGTKALGHFAARTTKTNAKTVSRAYGGVLSGDQVRDRIIRAFLVEEQRIARRMDLDKKMYKKLKGRRVRKDKKKKAKTAAAAKKVGVKIGGKKAAPAAKKATTTVKATTAAKPAAKAAKAAAPAAKVAAKPAAKAAAPVAKPAAKTAKK
jgi:large subunit ribosomal protein L34e